MDWLVVAVQWMHVVLGILWFGNALVLALIVIPAINRLPIVDQRRVAGYIGDRAIPLLDVVAPAVIVLGFVRGTLLGPIRSVASLGTPYGLTWLVALIAAIATFGWAKLVIDTRVAAMNALPVNPDGTPTPAIEAATNGVKRAVGLELIGFLTIFTCMILMRFGA